jgi:hypothetical protein
MAAAEVGSCEVRFAQRITAEPHLTSCPFPLVRSCEGLSDGAVRPAGAQAPDHTRTEVEADVSVKCMETTRRGLAADIIEY